MLRFAFYYRGIFKREIEAETFQDALEKLIAGGSIFGIDPEDYDEYQILEGVC